MKQNLNAIIRPVTTSVFALLLVAGVNNFAFADNAEALKDAIKTDDKVAEVKTTEMKEVESTVKTPIADDTFKALDANKDGKVSLKEAVKDKALTSSFDLTDVNHDGMISTDEYAGYKAVSAASPDAAPTAATN